jgi:uncharacterized protein YidB (DUF937 family)
MTTAGPAEWKATLQDALTRSYEMTKTGLDRVRIAKAGTVLTVRKDNINGDVASSMFQLVNKVTPDGTIVQGSGEGNGRVFKVGDKVYLYKIEVKSDAVLFEVLSTETFQVMQRGSDHQTRYKAVISFQFAPGTLEGMSPDAVKKVVDDVIAPEATVSAATTKTVELGQTPEQVEAAIGKPDTIVNLGAKKTYVYKTMKVIFQDGKVADVQ